MRRKTKQPMNRTDSDHVVIDSHSHHDRRTDVGGRRQLVAAMGVAVERDVHGVRAEIFES